jgi:hypothetical protein
MANPLVVQVGLTAPGQVATPYSANHRNGHVRIETGGRPITVSRADDKVGGFDVSQSQGVQHLVEIP